MRYLVIIITTLLTCSLSAQSHSDRQQLKLDVSQYEEVHVYNRKGKVSVKGSSTSQGIVNINRKLKAKKKSKLQEAMSTIYIDTMVMDDVLVIFVESPYYYLDGGQYDSRFLHYQNHDEYNWGNNWKKRSVEYEFDLDINLPATTNLVVSTHWGDLQVEGISGELAAMNHHDNVYLNDVSKVYLAESHHGDVTVNMNQLPSSDIEFDTHHGDIKVSVPSVPSAEISFDSHHGSFYTDFDWKTKAPKVVKGQRKTNKKTKYKLGDGTTVQMGTGAYNLTFDTHHGDMYLLQL